MQKKGNDTHAVFRHDLKNEITVIKAFSELIKRSKDSSSKIKDHAEKINQKANKIVEMIDDYLK